MKRIHHKEKQEQQTSNHEEHHHTLGTLIDKVPSRPIIIPPNKATYSDTNNLVPTPAFIKLFDVLKVFIISCIHLFQATLP